jgi:elongator complex protein 1
LSTLEIFPRHISDSERRPNNLYVIPVEAKQADRFFIPDGSDSPLTSFPEICLQIETVNLLSKEKDCLPNSVFIGLGKSGQLNTAKVNSESSILSGNVTSFTVTANFVIFTTNTHEAIFMPVKDLSNFKVGDTVSTTTLSRKVERGSRIVTVMPSSMSLVLQMSRGNLETINTIPLVMEVVKQDLDASAILLFGRYTAN